MRQRFLTKLKSLVSDEQEGILLAISGGIDSMVLLNLFSQTNYRVEVAHCNFQLRGDDSEHDMQLVQTSCSNYGIPFHGNRFETGKYAEEKGISIQMAARDLRYAWFEKLSKANGLVWIATAHHSDDQIETILLNLVRGTGVQGLTGIREVNGNRLRPLLHFRREEIEFYAAKNALVWREDSSNEKDDYKRNFLRHRVVPLLKQQNPSLNETFIRFGQRMEVLAEFSERKFQEFSNNHIESNDFTSEMDRDLFFNKDYRVFTEKWLENHGFNYSVISSVFDPERELEPGKIYLSKNYKLLSDRYKMVMSRIHSANTVYHEITSEEGYVTLYWGRQLNWSLISSLPDESLLREKNHAFLDLNEDRMEITLRNWEAGDKMKPFGMHGHRLISDMLVDQKMSHSEKEKQLVLLVGGKIAWLVGQRISADFALNEHSSRILHLWLS